MRQQNVFRVGFWLLLASSTGGMSALSAENETPAVPPAVNEGEVTPEQIEPEVRIINQRGSTIEEYRVQGRLYMVKVTPAKGYPYYLVDSDGDGSLETRRNDIDPDVVIPRWTILSWP